MIDIRAIHSNSDTRKRSVAIAVRASLRRTNAVLLSTTALLVVTPYAMAQTETASEPTERGTLAEVVVTAQRRTQSAQDIPYNISVVGGADIANSGATNVNDLARIVNGLVTVDQGPGARAAKNDMTLRGLRTDSPGGGSGSSYLPSATVNSVSTYFGETPIFFPMVLTDIERIEVLRGPQGTLYGSGAQAGTIRVIPKRPDLSDFGVEVSATGSATAHSDKMNSNARAVVNIPLADTVALRLVGGYEHLAGFIDAVNFWERDANHVPVPSVPGNLSSGPVIGPRQNDINSSDQGFGRAALRWQPTDAIDIQLDYLHQRTTQDNPQVSSPLWRGGCVDVSSEDVAASTPTCAGAPASAFFANAGGPYTTAAFTPEPYEDTVDLGSLAASIDLGFANLTSVTSYFEDSATNPVDLIAAATNAGAGTNFSIFPPYNGYPRLNVITEGPTTNKSFVQEVRLASKGGGRFDYVVGAFYQREKRDTDSKIFEYGLDAFNVFIGQPSTGDMQSETRAKTVYTDKAVFGELTAHITDQWQVTGGLRFFRDEFSLDSVAELPVCGVACSQDQVDPRGLTVVSATQKYSDHLLKVNTSYDLAKDTKIYATYSEGFRRGGSNGLPITGPFASLPQYQGFTPDSAKNYEVGIKGELLARSLRYSLAVYRIDLSNFQFNSYSPSGYVAVYNGTTARSQGVELEMQALVTDRLSVSAGYTYTDAKTTDSVQLTDLVLFATGPDDVAEFLNLPADARLPGVPRTSATLGLDYDVPLQSQWTLRLHADGVYRDSAPGAIDDTRVFYWTVPSSIVANARASLDFNQQLGLDLFVTNVSSETAYSGAAYAQTVSHPYQLRNVARPRTVGLTLRYKF